MVSKAFPGPCLQEQFSLFSSEVSNQEVCYPCTTTKYGTPVLIIMSKMLMNSQYYVLGVPSLVVVMEVINFSSAYLPNECALIIMVDPITCLPVTKRTSFGENAQQFTMPSCLSMMLRHCPLIYKKNIICLWLFNDI